MPTFAARLQQSIREHSPLCVGVDPSASLLKSAGLPDSAEGALAFGQRVLEAARVSNLHPEAAVGVLRTLRFERPARARRDDVRWRAASEVLVLLDGKRGDIDTTGAAYAEGYFSATTTLRVDAVTTHAYLGFGALDPFLDIAARSDGGVFVVVRSSNPEGRELQTAKLASGETVAQHLCREITAAQSRAAAQASVRSAPWSGATCETPQKPSPPCRSRSSLRRASARRARRCTTC